MTIQELIDQLSKVEDKSRAVKLYIVTDCGYASADATGIEDVWDLDPVYIQSTSGERERQRSTRIEEEIARQEAREAELDRLGIPR